MSAKAYGLQDIKKEFAHLNAAQLADLCLRLARYKKENKELLAYLLFNAHNEADFIEQVKHETGLMFYSLPSPAYQTAKGLRKILRLITKYNKFIASKPAEIELLMSFCNNYIDYMDRITYKPLRLILLRQVEKVQKLISKLHEDLQFDFSTAYQSLLERAAHKYSWFNKNDFRL